MADIPECFDHPGAGFVTLTAGIKFPPQYTGWQKPENARTFQEAQEHARKGGNVGILAGNGYIGLDQDEAIAFWSLKLPKTTTWETRPGKFGIEPRYGLRFKCSDVAEALEGIGKKADLSQLYLFHLGSQCGEIKLQRSYQVIPPSWKEVHMERADYRQIKDVPPAEISLVKLLADLQAIGITFSSKLEQNTAKLEKRAKEARQKSVMSDETRAHHYAEAALRDEVLTMVGAQDGERNNQLNLSTYAMAQFIAAGVLTEREVISELTRAAENTGLDSEEIQKTIISALEAGKKHPRKIPEPEETGKQKQKDAPKAEPAIDITSTCSLVEMGEVFTKWLYIQEAYNLTSFFAGVIANFCDGSPDILGIVAPSGSNKTELIRSLGETQNQYVYPVSTITQHTLVSGHKDSNDLVPQLKGRILTIKDLTSILACKEDVRAAIFADFRELTDEYIRKEFGNGIAKEYRDVHSSIIFASTTAIERYYSMYSNLGQRMIFFRPKNDPKKARERARQNRDKQKVMRAELHDVAMRFIASMLKVKDANGLPTTPDNIAEEMGELFDFLAIARTTIHHDYRTGDIDELPEPEFPTRIANTVGRLMEVHAMMNGREEVNGADMAFGCRIISDNIPSMRWKILRALTTEWQHTAKISKSADLPPRAVKYHLDELVALGLVEKLLKDELEDTMDHRFDYFRLSEMAADALEKYDTRNRIEDIIKDKLTKLIEINNISLSNPCVISPGKPEEQTPSKPLVDGGEGEEKEEPKAVSHAGKDDPGLSRFKAGIRKRTCVLCGEQSLHDLVIHYNGGFICSRCHREGPPSAPAKPADAQSTLTDS